GTVTMSVTPMNITPGNYWVMAIYNIGGAVSYYDPTSTKTVYYTSLAFGSPLPTNASGFTSYVGQDFNYWMNITCGATICNAGNETPTFPTTGSFGPNFILGTKMTATSSGTLTGLSMTGISGTGSLVQMGLYADNAGAPGALLRTSATATVTAGTVTMAVTPMAITPGNYWVMAIYNIGGAVSYYDPTSTKTVYYTSLPFG